MKDVGDQLAFDRPSRGPSTIEYYFCFAFYSHLILIIGLSSLIVRGGFPELLRRDDCVDDQHGL